MKRFRVITDKTTFLIWLDGKKLYLKEYNKEQCTGICNNPEIVLRTLLDAVKEVAKIENI